MILTQLGFYINILYLYINCITKYFFALKGREQAEFTGKRLNEIAQNFKFNKVIHSNMIRAIETADLIRKELPADIPVTMDPLLAEGAPIPPEPPVGHWRPEVYVVLFKLVIIAKLNDFYV